MNEETNMVALVKGNERYIFLYTHEHTADVLRAIGRFASNKDLSFSWYDAAVLSQRIRREAARQSQKKNRIKEII